MASLATPLRIGLFLVLFALIALGLLNLQLSSFPDNLSHHIRNTPYFFDPIRQTGAEVIAGPPPNRTTYILYAEPSIVEFMGKHMLGQAPSCPISCEYAVQPNLHDYSAKVFHLPTFGGLPITKGPEEKWVIYTMESASQYSALADKEFLAKFDYKMTYQMDSDVIAGYWSGKESAYRNPPKPKTPGNLVAFFASNCGSLNNRENYVRELSKYIKVDSFGSCMHNKDVPDGDKGKKSKIEVISTYKFYLAFENSNGKDYVTEKVFHGLHSGTVPVYMGAPNIDQFMPDDKAIIRTTDFTSPKELAEYLLMLSVDEERYSEHLAWKNKPFARKFQRLQKIQELDARCRLCLLVYNGTRFGL